MSQKALRLFYWVVPILLLSLCPLVLNAQESATQEKKEEKAEQKAEKKGTHPTKTVTGCLQKADEPDEFAITGEDGKTYGLRSTDVKLAEHVGHKVTVTGTSTRESKEEKSAESKEKKEGQVEKAAGKEEIGDLKVTDLKMVSASCNK
ncbi:MAG: hypothetical protein DMG71_12475 [Acidobacteria bacterium]|nr:MAG: hypothetical protein DMG71_12475 [Acidobacteriota bacterium]